MQQNIDSQHHIVPKWLPVATYIVHLCILQHAYPIFIYNIETFTTYTSPHLRLRTHNPIFSSYVIPLSSIHRQSRATEIKERKRWKKNKHSSYTCRINHKCIVMVRGWVNWFFVRQSRDEPSDSNIENALEKLKI